MVVGGGGGNLSVFFSNANRTRCKQEIYNEVDCAHGTDKFWGSSY